MIEVDTPQLIQRVGTSTAAIVHRVAEAYAVADDVQRVADALANRDDLNTWKGEPRLGDVGVCGMETSDFSGVRATESQHSVSELNRVRDRVTARQFTPV
jgi:hypothetical protein